MQRANIGLYSQARPGDVHRIALCGSDSWRHAATLLPALARHDDDDDDDDRDDDEMLG